MRRLALLLLLAAAPAAADPLVVHEREIADRKAVVATVEPVHQLVARARIGGTIAALSIKEGDDVTAGAVVAEVADAKLALRSIRASPRSSRPATKPRPITTASPISPAAAFRRRRRPIRPRPTSRSPSATTMR